MKKRIQQLVGLIKGLIQDARIPKQDKVILGGLLALLISPVDLIPDFIPVLGYLDDFFMWVLLLDYLFHRIDPGVLADHYPWDLRGYQRMSRWVGYISWVVPGFLKNRIWAQVKTEAEDTLQQKG
ncbi:MAG: YkvA family protein [candidate division NC10 bacterium]|nr:YkvA family protein [candidate division NC10 bacterium]